MKICSKCKCEKSGTDYYKSARAKDGLQSMCKVCMRPAYNANRLEKIDHYKNVRRNRETKNKERLSQWKEQQQCKFCPEHDPDCLDLHHLDRTKKDIDVADAVYRWSWERLTTELEKCIVVCANCHRKIHKGKIIP